jgi:hypothetical protein
MILLQDDAGSYQPQSNKGQETGPPTHSVLDNNDTKKNGINTSS